MATLFPHLLCPGTHAGFGLQTRAPGGRARATHHFTVEGEDPGVSVFRKFFIESLDKAREVLLAAVLHVLLRAAGGGH